MDDTRKARPKRTRVYLDFETTTTGDQARMTQYAMMSDEDGDGISSYVYTTEPVHPEAYKVSGIGNAELDIYKNRGETQEPDEALRHMVDYVRAAADEVVLVAYNGRRLDFPVLLNEMLRHLKDAEDIIMSLNITYMFDPYCITQHWDTTGRRRQKDIYRILFQDTYNEHDALDDTRALRRVVQHERISSVVDVYAYDRHCNERFSTYRLNISHKYKAKMSKHQSRIQASMRARNIAQSFQRSATEKRKQSAATTSGNSGGPPKRVRFATTSAKGECTVVRLRRVNGVVTQDCDVYIGRKWDRGGWDLEASKWANPFMAKKASEKAEAVEKFRDYLMDNEELMACIGELKGKSLGCWCKPGPCHGDVLAELANKA